jgi:hypothetical protein
MSEYTTDGAEVTRATFSSQPTGPVAPRRAPPPPPEQPGVSTAEQGWAANRARIKEQVARTKLDIANLESLRLTQRLQNVESPEAARAVAVNVVPYASMSEAVADMATPLYKSTLFGDEGKRFRGLVAARIAAMDAASSGELARDPVPSRNLSDLHPDLDGQLTGYTTRAQIVEAVRAIRKASYLEQPAMQKLHEAKIAATNYSRLL